MTHALAFPGANEIVAWHAHIDLLETRPELRASAVNMLQPHERNRFDRYREDADRLMFLLGRAMARAMVGRSLGVPHEAWSWQEGPHGRPEVGGTSLPIRFNLAHSAGLVVCAIAQGREVGADVEDLARRAPDPLVVSRYCSPGEVAEIDAPGNPDWTRRFLAYWTLKEAYLKARGLGISVPLAEIEFTVNGSGARVAFLGSLQGTDDRWAFRLTPVRERYLVALAAAAPAHPPSFTLAPMPEDAF